MLILTHGMQADVKPNDMGVGWLLKFIFQDEDPLTVV